MRDTRLILVDGLPGAGKSTTSRLLADWIRASGVPVTLLPETFEGHPLNVGGPLHPAGETTDGELFRLYSPGEYIRESLARWRDFVSAVQPGQNAYILDSYPIQNSVRILFQMELGQEALQDYAWRAEAEMAPLHPLILYFELKEPVQHLLAICKSRGDEWTAGAVQIMTSSPYAVSRGLHGLEGALRCLEDYKAVSDELIRHSRLPALVLKGGAGQWEQCHDEIRKFLDLAEASGTTG
jgi:hypothetical protein